MEPFLIKKNKQKQNVFFLTVVLNVRMYFFLCGLFSIIFVFLICFFSPILGNSTKHLFCLGGIRRPSYGRLLKRICERQP